MVNYLDLEAWQVWKAASDLVLKKACRRCRGAGLTGVVYHKRCETLQTLARNFQGKANEVRAYVKCQLEHAEEMAAGNNDEDSFWEEQADRLRRRHEGIPL